MSLSPEALEQHLQKVRGGDTDAFRVVAGELASFLYRQAWAVTREHAAAEDAVQDALLELWKVRASLPAEVPAFRAYAMRAARNRALNRVRNVNTRRRHEHASVDQWTDATTDDPVNEMIAREAWDLVYSLPANLRDVLLLRFGYGLTLDEVAAELGVPVGTVSTFQRRALMELRGRLEVRAGAIAVSLPAAAMLEAQLTASLAAADVDPDAPPTLRHWIGTGMLVGTTRRSVSPAAVLSILAAVVAIIGALQLGWLTGVRPDGRNSRQADSRSGTRNAGPDAERPAPVGVQPSDENSNAAIETGPTVPLVDNRPVEGGPVETDQAPTTGEVIGRLVTGGGQSVAGITVHATPPADAAIPASTCVSGADGTFQFTLPTSDTAGAQWKIRVDGLSHDPQYVDPVEVWRVSLRPEESVDLGTITLFRPGRISGVVIGPDGEPVPGAFVMDTRYDIRSSDLRDPELGFRIGNVNLRHVSRFRAQTNEAGEFLVDGLVPRLHQFEVSSGHHTTRYPSRHLSVAIPEGGAVPPLVIRLGENSRLSVTTIDEAGRPVPDVLVLVGTHRVRVGRTDALGRLSVPSIVEDQLPIWTESDGLTVFHQIVAMQPGEAREVTLPVLPPARIKGRVVDREGEPVSDQSMSLLSGAGRRRIQTDEDGRFELIVSPDEGTFQGTMTLAGYTLVDLGVWQVHPGQHIELGSLTLARLTGPLGGLHGSLADARGRGVSTRTVILRPREASVGLRSAATDTNGEFRFERVPSGDYELLLAGADATPVTIAPDSVARQSIQLRPPADRRVAGRVVNIDGSAVSGARVTAGWATVNDLFFESGHSTPVHSAGDGSFQIVAGEAPVLRVDTPDGSSRLITIDGRPGKDDELTVVLPDREPGGAVSIRVVNDEDNRPLPACRVILRSDRRPGDVRIERLAVTDADGHAAVADLAPGTYRATVSAAGWASRVHDVVVTSDDTTTFSIPLARAGAVALVITGLPANTPVQCRVDIPSGPTGYSRDVRATAPLVAIGRLPLGSACQITVSAPGYQTVRFRTVAMPDERLLHTSIRLVRKH